MITNSAPTTLKEVRKPWIKNIDSSHTSTRWKNKKHGEKRRIARRTLQGSGTGAKEHYWDLELRDDGRSAGVAGGKQLNGQRLDGIKREETDERKQGCHMERRGNVRPGGGTHPRANAGAMHTGAYGAPHAGVHALPRCRSSRASKAMTVQATAHTMLLKNGFRIENQLNNLGADLQSD